MITLRKLASLSDGTRRRKIVALLKDFEEVLMQGERPDYPYLKQLVEMIADDPGSGESLCSKARRVSRELSAVRNVRGGLAVSPESILRSLNALRHGMLSTLGLNIADWDMTFPGDRRSDSSRTVFPLRVYLEDLRSPFNVGSIFRTATAFGFEKIWVSPDCADPEHARSRRSAMGTVDYLDWERAKLQDLGGDETGTIFALEIGGRDMNDFVFPENGTVILGSEELGVSPELLELSGDGGGVVSIGLPGPKASLNVGVAFGILAEHWVQGRGKP